MYFCVSLLVALSLLAHAIAQPQNSRARSAASYVERGSAEYAKGEWDKAIADFDLALTLDPHSAPAFYNRGLAHIAKGDLIAAIADFNQAIALNPKLAEAYANRGSAHYLQVELELV
jgi:tetratricopeptide (TPR) repeat protein